MSGVVFNPSIAGHRTLPAWCELSKLICFGIRKGAGAGSLRYAPGVFRRLFARPTTDA